mgnify:CR=1 FL=1
MTTPIQRALEQLSAVILGKEEQLKLALSCLLARGHLLIEDLPGMGKTTLSHALAGVLGLQYNRIQFTSDLLPADILGVSIFERENGSDVGRFRFHPGPVFTQLLLADEINRAPAKVQSALLEAMAERQITVGSKTYPLPPLFLVMATQNPLEQEGTYPLPEAQLDRFLMHVDIDYPDAQTELEILRLTRGEALSAPPVTPPTLSQEDIFSARKAALSLHMAPELEQYLVQLIMATRKPERFDANLAQWIALGTSPRATISLDKCARAHAWLAGRDFVGPDDIQAVAHNVLRHRIILSYEAEAEGVTVNDVLDKIVATVAVP